MLRTEAGVLRSTIGFESQVPIANVREQEPFIPISNPSANRLHVYLRESWNPNENRLLSATRNGSLFLSTNIVEQRRCAGSWVQILSLTLTKPLNPPSRAISNLLHNWNFIYSAWTNAEGPDLSD